MINNVGCYSLSRAKMPSLQLIFMGNDQMNLEDNHISDKGANRLLQA